jgi:hypothetical protein
LDYHFNGLIRPLAYSILVVLLLFLGHRESVAQETGASKATFIVK